MRLFLLGSIVSLAIALTGCTLPGSAPAPTVTDFASCAAAGYPIRETFPEQCQGPDGTLYVNTVSDATPQTFLERTAAIAETAVRTQAKTFTFDGFNLRKQSSIELACNQCTLHTFTFSSAHPGYGDRTDAILYQVAIEHTIEVRMSGEAVVSLVTDNQYNELTQTQR